MKNKVIAVIANGGMGTRLKPLTNNKSKGLVKVFNRTLLERALYEFLEVDLSQIIILCRNENVQQTNIFLKKSSLINFDYPHNIKIVGGCQESYGLLRKIINIFTSTKCECILLSFIDEIYLSKQIIWNQLLKFYNEFGVSIICLNDNESSVDLTQISSVNYTNNKDNRKNSSLFIGKFLLNSHFLDEAQNCFTESKEYELFLSLNSLANNGLLIGYNLSEQHLDCGTLNGLEHASLFFYAKSIGLNINIDDNLSSIILKL